MSYRWYDQAIVRPFTLSWWAMSGKHWHPQRKRLALLRSLYWFVIRRHETEICSLCGGPVRLVFHIPDEIWERAAGFAITKRRPDGEAAPGVLCPPCFDDLAAQAGLPFLRWTCAIDDSVMSG